MTTTIKNIKITQSIQWTCRRWGGVFLGLRINFPVTITDYDGKNNNSVWRHIFIGLGFFFFTWNIDIDYNFRDEPVK